MDLDKYIEHCNIATFAFENPIDTLTNKEIDEVIEQINKDLTTPYILLRYRNIYRIYEYVRNYYLNNQSVNFIKPFNECLAKYDIFQDIYVELYKRNKLYIYLRNDIRLLNLLPTCMLQFIYISYEYDDKKNNNYYMLQIFFSSDKINLTLYFNNKTYIHYNEYDIYIGTTNFSLTDKKFSNTYLYCTAQKSKFLFYDILKIMNINHYEQYVYL